MTDFTARLAVTLHVMGGRLADRMKEDKGQTSAEYVGILVFVAAIIAAIFLVKTDAAKILTDAIKTAFTSVTNAGT